MLSRKQLKQNAKANLKGNLGTSIGVTVVYSLLLSLAGSTGIGAILLSGPFGLGMNMYFLDVRRKGRGDFNTLFKGFDSFGGAFATYFFMELFLFLWALLFIIPAIIKSYSYFLAMYIMCDNPSISGTDAITLSRKMMDGNKGRLFVLMLSFIGWELLSVLTFGILSIVYVTPYMYQTFAEFYDDVKSDYEAKHGPIAAAAVN